MEQLRRENGITGLRRDGCDLRLIYTCDSIFMGEVLLAFLRFQLGFVESRWNF